ncbi:MAG TPA: XRE family transcriptional regulator [Caulobacteraceae bacterium]|jgi:predicted DNA-binding transcriptional regulator AlpA
MTRNAVHGYAPRGLRRESAASYVGLGVTKFDQLVADGRMPPPRKVDGCVIWDRAALDAAFDDLPAEPVNAVPAAGGNPWDEVLDARAKA